MPDAYKNILESKPEKKSLKHAFIIYVDLECLLLKMNACNNNPNKSYATAKALHKPTAYCLLTSCSFDKSENCPSSFRSHSNLAHFEHNLERVKRLCPLK